MITFFRISIKVVLLVLACGSAFFVWQKAQLSVLALSRIDPVPKVSKLVSDQRYAEAAEYLGFFMDYGYVHDDPEAQALETQINAERESLKYQARKLGEGLIWGTSDEGIGKMAGVTTDFFVVGDVRDLAMQGAHWVRGEETDEVIAALAGIGIVATAAQVGSAVATVGTSGAAVPAAVGSTAVKGGVSILKIAHKLGKLPPWLGQTLMRRAKVVQKTKKLNSVTGLLQDVSLLARTRGGLKLLSKTRDAGSLRRMAAAVERFGGSAATLYEIGGKEFINAAGRVSSLGTNSIKLAATYGHKGLRVLDEVGSVRFFKYSSRASRIAYKGDFFNMVARFLGMLPMWGLYFVFF